MRAGESVRYWRHPALGGLDLMRARFVEHSFGRHSHETFAIGVHVEGVEEIGFRDGAERIGAGATVLINPGEVHTGRPSGRGAWAYRVLYPSLEQLAAIGREIGVPGRSPFLRRRVIDDEQVAGWVVTAHRAAEGGEPLAAECWLHAVLAHLLGRYGAQRRRTGHGTAAGRGSVARAREALHESLADPPGLQELAAVVGAEPFALLRSFRRAYGLPPHAYVTQLRVRKARELLACGLPPATVAASVGFYDQSHLTRQFRRIVGVPPGAYQRAVQERPSLGPGRVPNVAG